MCRHLSRSALCQSFPGCKPPLPAADCLPLGLCRVLCIFLSFFSFYVVFYPLPHLFLIPFSKIYCFIGKSKTGQELGIIVTVQPSASLLRNPAHLKFAFGKGLDSLAEFTRSYGLCSKCKVLGWTVTNYSTTF